MISTHDSFPTTGTAGSSSATHQNGSTLKPASHVQVLPRSDVVFNLLIDFSSDGDLALQHQADQRASNGPQTARRQQPPPGCFCSEQILQPSIAPPSLAGQLSTAGYLPLRARANSRQDLKCIVSHLPPQPMPTPPQHQPPPKTQPMPAKSFSQSVF